MWGSKGLSTGDRCNEITLGLQSNRVPTYDTPNDRRALQKHACMQGTLSEEAAEINLWGKTRRK